MVSPESGPRCGASQSALPAPYLQRTRNFTLPTAVRSAPPKTAVKLPTALGTMSNLTRPPNFNCSAIAKNTIARVLAKQPESATNGHTIAAVQRALLRSTVEPCKSPSSGLHQTRPPTRQREPYSRHITANKGSFSNNNRGPTLAVPSQNRTSVRRSSAPDVRRTKQDMPKAPPDVQLIGTFVLPPNHYGMLRQSVENAKVMASTMNGVQKESAGAGSWQNLPDAARSRPLVAGDQYTKYSTSGVRLQVMSQNDARHRSLPASGVHAAPYPKGRHTISAPTAAQNPRHIATLINKPEGGGAHRNPASQSGALDITFPTRVICANSFPCGAAAGVPTKVPPQRNPLRFASAWADARVEHVRRDPLKPELTPRGKGGNADDVQSKSKKSTMESPSKREPSKSLGHTPRTHVTEGSPETEPPHPKSILKSSNNEGEDDTRTRKVSRVRTTLLEPTRRERVKQMQRHKSLSLLGGIPRKTSKGAGKGKAGAEGYSLDDAAAVYYATIIREKSAIEELPDARTVATPDSQGESGKNAAKEHVLNKREVETYKRINSVYGAETSKFRKNRQNDFFKKLEELQVDEWKRSHREYKDEIKKRRQSKLKQKEQLKIVRDKFEDEQIKRFQSQYVTGKILEHEWVTRGLYGLPDTLSDAPEYPTVKSKPKTQKPKNRIDTEELHKKNTRKFSKMFEINQGPRWDPYAKEPLMEGKDRIMLETEDGKGGKHKVKTDVKDVMRDAKKMLEGMDDDDSLILSETDDDSGLDLGPSQTAGYSVDERLREDDLLDDDDDAASLEGDMAFRRAMTKYGIDIDLSDDET